MTTRHQRRAWRAALQPHTLLNRAEAIAALPLPREAARSWLAGVAATARIGGHDLYRWGDVLAAATGQGATEPALLSDYLTVDQAAAFAQVNERTIREWVTQGRLARYSAGARLRVKRENLEELLRAKPAGVDTHAEADRIIRSLRR